MSQSPADPATPQIQLAGLSSKIQRMGEWLGVTGYCLKDCVLNAAAQYVPSLELPQKIAGHTKVVNTKRYTRESAIGASLYSTS